MIYRDEETYHIFDEENNSGGDQQFEYKESYWDDMEAMLDQHEAKKKKRRGFFLMFSSTAVIALLVLGLYNWNYTTIDFPDLNLSESLQKIKSEKSIIDEQNSINKSDLELDKNSELNKVTDAMLVDDPSKVVRSNPNNRVDKHANANNQLSDKDLKAYDDLISNHVISIDPSTVESLGDNSNMLTEEGLVKLNPKEFSLESTSSQIVLEKRKIKFPLKHSLSLNVEAGLVNKYQPGKGVSYAIMTGFGYELDFHKNLSFQTGANIIYRDGLSQVYRNETRQYGFHSTRYYQDIAYKGQFNIEIPVSLKVKFRRSSISAGIGTSFLIGVRSSVEQYMPESTSVESIKNNFGIKEGIRQMDVNLNLNYAYAVSPNVEVNVGFSAGLLDQLDNEFFSNDSKDHNLQFRAGLKYYFFNK